MQHSTPTMKAVGSTPVGQTTYYSRLRAFAGGYFISILIPLLTRQDAESWAYHMQYTRPMLYLIIVISSFAAYWLKSQNRHSIINVTI